MHPQQNVFFPTAAQFVLTGAPERGQLSAWACCRQGCLCTKWQESVPARRPCPLPSPSSPQLSIGSGCRFPPSSAVPCHPDSCLCPAVRRRAMSKRDDAASAELPLGKAGSVAGDGSDWQPVTAGPGCCRLLREQTGFLWLELYSSWGQIGVGDQLELATGGAGSCIARGYFC